MAAARDTGLVARAAKRTVPRLVAAATALQVRVERTWSTEGKSKRLRRDVHRRNHHARRAGLTAGLLRLHQWPDVPRDVLDQHGRRRSTGGWNEYHQLRCLPLTADHVDLEAAGGRAALLLRQPVATDLAAARRGRELEARRRGGQQEHGPGHSGCGEQHRAGLGSQSGLVRSSLARRQCQCDSAAPGRLTLAGGSPCAPKTTTHTLWSPLLDLVESADDASC